VHYILNITSECWYVRHNTPARYVIFL